MNRYLDERDEINGLPVLPFFMACRALIRAYVLATQSKQTQDGSRDKRANISVYRSSCWHPFLHGWSSSAG